MVHHINKLKDKNHTIISIDAEKQNSTSFYDKTLGNVTDKGLTSKTYKQLTQLNIIQHHKNKPI